MISNPLIKITNLVKTFKVGESIIRSLNGVNLAVQPGEFLIIEGASGSGKTTLLNMLAGLEPYDNGDIFVLGKSLRTFKEKEMEKYRRHDIGMVFQNFNLMSSLSAWENVALPLRFDGVRAGVRKKRALELLDLVGLKDRAKHLPLTLSGGEQQRVAIARALTTNPKVLLVDEPTGNLDSSTGAEVMNLLKELNEKHDRTIVLVTHNPLYSGYGERILTMKDGQIIAEQKMAKMKSKEKPVSVENISSFEPPKFRNKMRLLDILSLSLKHFYFAKMRTFLTVLGMAIGITSIVLFVSLGFGLQKITTASVASLEEMKTLSIAPAKSNEAGISEETTNNIRAISGVEMVSPEVTLDAIGTLAGTGTTVSAEGIDPANFDFEGVKIVAGQKFTDANANEVVISKTALVNWDISDQEKVLNQTLKLQLPNPKTSVVSEIDLKVVGISEVSLSPAVYLPIAVLQKKADLSTYTSLTAKISDIDKIDGVKSEIENMGLEAVGVIGMIKKINQIFLTVQLVLGLIGAIALIVASFGVINTMTMSLLERTREIGVMEALGISSNDVKRLFIYESCYFGFFGGLLGIIAGFLVGIGINRVIGLAMSHGNTIGNCNLFVTPYKFAIIVFLFSILISRIAGVYPSWSAMRKSPLDALRYE